MFNVDNYWISREPVRPAIIAEIGLMHGGDAQRAIELLLSAADSHADIVKFQLYDTDSLVDKNRMPDWHERLRKKSLSFRAMKEVADAARKRGIPFLCTPHTQAALDFLVQEIKVTAIKVGSGEYMNEPFLRKIAWTKLPVIASLGLDGPGGEYKDLLLRVFSDVPLILCHTVTQYPTPFEWARLDKIPQLFGARPADYGVGYSDHTMGTRALRMAAAMGVCLLEKHFFDLHSEDIRRGQDFPGALCASDFSLVAQEIQHNAFARSESMRWAAKSPVAARDIPKGKRIEPGDFRMIRAGGHMRGTDVCVPGALLALEDIPAGTLFSVTNIGHWWG